MQRFQDYKQKRMARDTEFWKDYPNRYETFKLGVLLKQAREKSGLTQEQMAEKLQLSKKLISKMENDAPDVRLSNLEKFAEAVGKKLYVILD